MVGRTLFWGTKFRGNVLSVTWNSAEQRAYVVYRDESGQDRTVYADGASPREAKQAVLDDLMERANAARK